MKASINTKEYGIVLTLDTECSDRVKQLNQDIANKLAESNLTNSPNTPHVTLYHLACENNDLEQIANDLKKFKKEDIKLEFFGKIYCTLNRWIDLGVKKTEELLLLHKEIVNKISPYHKEPLQRCTDIFYDLNEEQQTLVNEYGVTGVMKMYNPHTTLFYQYPPNKVLQDIVETMKEEVNITCAGKLSLVELGYNGNVIEVLDII